MASFHQDDAPSSGRHHPVDGRSDDRRNATSDSATDAAAHGIRPCPTCSAPLSEGQAASRLHGSVCVSCTVFPPTTDAGDVIFCSRTGQLLTPQDFLEGRAIRVGRRCFSLEAVRGDRETSIETGRLRCDGCGSRIPLRHVGDDRAGVIDRVLLCERCRERDPDPAGTKRAEREGRSISNELAALPTTDTVGAGVREDESMALASLPGAAEDDVPDSRTASAPSTRESSSAARADRTGDSARSLPVDVDDVQTNPAGDDALNGAVLPRDRDRAQPRTKRGARPTIGSASRVRKHAEAGEGRPRIARPTPPTRPAVSARSARPAVVLPASTAGATGSAGTDDGAAADLSLHALTALGAIGRTEQRAALGVLILMIFVLCGLLLAVFVNGQVRRDDSTAALREEVSRLEARVSAINGLLEEQRRIIRDRGLPVGPPRANEQPADPGPQIGSDTGTADPTPADVDEQVGPTPTATDAGSDTDADTDPTPPVDPRIAALTAEEPSDRLFAVYEVQTYSLFDAIPALIERVRADEDAFVRAAAAQALRMLRATEAEPTLQAAATSDPSPTVQLAAREALAAIR